jgi:hypothetical protein
MILGERLNHAYSLLRIGRAIALVSSVEQLPGKVNHADQFPAKLRQV